MIFHPFSPPNSPSKATAPGGRQGHASREAGHILSSDLGQSLAAVGGESFDFFFDFDFDDENFDKYRLVIYQLLI